MLFFHVINTLLISLVSVNGFVPRTLSSFFSPLKVARGPQAKKISQADIEVIESPFRFMRTRYKKEICRFSENVPKFNLFKRQSENKNSISSVSLPKDVPGSFSILNELNMHNASVSFFQDNCTFKILPIANDCPPDYIPISLAKSPFKYLSNLKTEFYVYTDKNNEISNEICFPGYKTNGIFYFVLFILVAYIIIQIYSYRKLPLITNKQINFWILDSKLNIHYGPSLDVLNYMSLRVLKGHIKYAKLTNKLMNSTVQLHRHSNTISYDRLLVSPINGDKFIVILWEEFIPPKDTSELSICFNVENSDISSPTLTFSSYRDYRPVKINFVTENNVNVQIELPTAILAPFQPFGQILALYHTFLSFYQDSIKDNNFQEDTLADFMSKICSHIGANRFLIMTKQGNLIHQYCGDILQPIDNIQISKIPEMCSKIKPGSFIFNFLGDNDQCYITMVYNIIVLFSFSREITAIEIFGYPIASAFSLAVYQSILSKIQLLIFKRFLESLDSINRKFILIQFGLTSHKMISVKNSVIGEDPSTFSEYYELVKGVGLFDIDVIYNESKELAKKGGGIMTSRTNCIKNENRDLHYSLTGTVDYDKLLNEYVVSFFVEDTTEKKEHEAKTNHMKNFIQKTLELLKVHEMIINDGRIELEKPTLFEELGRVPKTEGETKSLNLLDLMEVEDLPLVSKIFSGKNVVFRLVNINEDRIWYNAISDGNYGIIFCIDNFKEVPPVKNQEDDGIQLASSSAQTIIWVVDPKDDTVHDLLMQPTIWDVLSAYPETKFSSIVDYINADDYGNFQLGYHRLLSGEIEQWIGDVRLMKMNGNFEWHRFLLATASNGQIHCLAFNIQKQKEMETKLEDTERLRDLMMSSGKLAQWLFYDNNDPLELMHRFDPGMLSVVKMNWDFIDKQVHPDYCDSFRQALRHAFDNDESIEIDLPLLLEPQIWISLRGKKSQTSRQIVGVCIDVTELWNAYSVLEEEKRIAEIANEQKTVFLANMSHEIRTPMNGIFGMLDVLALQDLSSEQSLLVESLRSSSSQLMRLLDDTLNLSKIEAGSIEVNRSVFSITKLIEPICIASGSSARLKKIQFYVVIDKSFPSFLYGDPQLLMQVVNNLVSNALKFTKTGSVTVCFKWIEKNNKEVCYLSVKDTGIGITPETQIHIFERFQQADASVQRFYGGSGLGLALVNDICNILGGSIKIESEFGKGSEFICELPMHSSLFAYSSPFSDGKTHVLMVEFDDQLLLNSFTNWMNYHHYTVQVFDNPENIVTLSKTEGYQIDAIFVEGCRDNWARIKHVVSRIVGSKTPVVCSICDAGESIFFNYNLSKPLIMEHLLSFMNSIRYNKSIEAQPSKQEFNAKDKNILIVEDNKANQFVMSKIMKNIGCSFKVADNGREAIDILDRESFDLIFMDCQMPVLDGIAATKEIRSSNKEYSSIPIVALTASAIEGDEQICRDAGMDDYLPKPVRFQQITKTIKHYTSEHNP